MITFYPCNRHDNEIKVISCFFSFHLTNLRGNCIFSVCCTWNMDNFMYPSGIKCVYRAVIVGFIEAATYGCWWADHFSKYANWSIIYLVIRPVEDNLFFLHLGCQCSWEGSSEAPSGWEHSGKSYKSFHQKLMVL